jgi:[acyl-carrier-protein] S-malonyltransferase
MKNYAILFAGQGSQYIGMGKDFYQKYDYVREMYSIASDILRYPLTEVCFNESDLINQTLYTQPAVLVTTCIIYEVINREVGIKPKVVSGFSLGEYSALYSSGVFSFKDVVYLVKKRAEFMNEAATNNPGAMVAVMGASRDELEELCLNIKDVAIANYNSPNQIVVGGVASKVDELINKLKELGKRCVKLNVSGGFHTKLMSDAANKMEKLLKDFNWFNPLFDVITNYNAKALISENLIETLKLQIESPVYFEDSIRLMIDDYQVDEFIEIGPGKVLSGFLKRIDSSKRVFSIDKLEDLINFKNI